MKIVCLILFVFIILTVDGNPSIVSADSETPQPKIPEYEKPVKVSLCDLKKNLADYNHKLIEVTGFISWGIEDFSISDPTCDSRQGIWLEYGMIYFTSESSRPKSWIIEGISVSPVVEDEKYKTFDQLIKRMIHVHAVIRGRFFSGKPEKRGDTILYRGFGHFGGSSLLVIEQIIDISPQTDKTLKYKTYDYQPEDKFYKDADGFETLDKNDVLESQRKAENGEREWSFTDPQRVVSEYLSRTLKIDRKQIIGIKQIRKYQGAVAYYWKQKSSKTLYIVVISRPYWLSFYAKDKNKVAWIVTEAYKSL